MKPKIWISIDAQPEIDLTKLFPFVKFDGIDNNSPVLTNSYQDSNISDGNTFSYGLFGKNTVNVNLDMSFGTYYDYQAKRQQLYDFFMQKKLFRIRTDADPMFVYFLRPVGFDIKPFQEGGWDCFIDIPFENPSGYKFSRYDSMNQLDFWNDFPLGWDIPAVSKEYFHFQNEADFELINPSSIPIDPYLQKCDFKIVISYAGSRISIINTDNDSVFTFIGENNFNRTIVLDGVNAYENENNVNDNTNFGYIKLEKGINHISVRGCEKFDIKFVFPFIYP